MSHSNSRWSVVIGVVIVGLAWQSVLGPAVAQSQPTVPPTPVPIQPDDPVTCPGGDNGGAVSGLEYIADPSDSNAYYICSVGAGSAPQQHLVCPAWATLQMSTTPPMCVQWRAQY
jgi:hypothetical protein